MKYKKSFGVILGFFLGVGFMLSLGASSEQGISLENEIRVLNSKVNANEAMLLSAESQIQFLGRNQGIPMRDLATSAYEQAPLREAQRRSRLKEGRRTKEEALAEYIEELRKRD